MDLLRSKLPELRYIYHNIKTLKQINSYIETASSGLVKTLFQIALNIVYSNNKETSQCDDSCLLKKNQESFFQDASQMNNLF